MKLKYYYQNVRGLKSKTKLFMSNLIENSYDVILLSETWLVSDVFSSELFDDRYIVYRNDRDRVLTKKDDGGGCLIAVKKELYSRRVMEWELEKEDVWISVEQINGGKTFFNVRYIELGSKLSDYEVHFDKISEIVVTANPKDTFILTGDYNLGDTVTWLFDSHAKVYKAINAKGGITSGLLDMLSFCNLKQLNVIRNNNGRTLDLIISNSDPQKVCISRSLRPLVPVDNHHPAIEVSTDLSPLKFLNEKRPPKTNYFKANFVQLNDELSKVDWFSELNELDIDGAVNRFYGILEPFIESIPKTRISVRDYPVYYTHELISLIVKKDNARLSYKNEKSSVRKSELKVKYSELRTKVKKEIKKCFTNYVSDCEEKIKTNTKCFFSFTKSLKKTNSLPSSMKLESEVSNDRASICNLFAKFFQSVYNDPDEEQYGFGVYDPFFYQNEAPKISSSVITPTQVELVLKKFNINKVASPDNIPMLFFVNLSLSLSIPLSILFNKSLEECKFPSKWKVSFVSPIFKDGDKNDVSNYRAVSIMCAASKIFERLVFNMLFELVKDMIDESQHGFFAGRSTQTNLMDYISSVAHEIVNGGQVDTIYTDFTKAFDKVSHVKLVNKFKDFGFSRNLLVWFSTYLADRSQFVVIGGSRSEKIVPSSGVPQGSILGPFLFILFINDLLTSLSSCYGFADDLKIYRSIKSGYDCALLQEDLEKIAKWCDDNGMVLNLGKCAVISITHSPNKICFVYGLANVVLERVSSIKDLGVIIDEKLSFKQHVEMITRKSYKMLGFIFRCGKYFRDQSSMLLLFNALVRNRLEYCSSVWNPHYEGAIDRIERVQKKFTRMFYFKFNMEHPRPEYNIRLKRLKMHSLESRRIENDEIMLFKIIHKYIDSRSLYQRLSFHRPTRFTRRNQLNQQRHPKQTFYLPKMSTNYEANAPINRIQLNHDKYFSSVNVLEKRMPFVKKRIRQFFEF